ETEGLLPRFVERREIRGPWVGLLTSAWTEKAIVAEATGSGLTALAVVTVGLSNRITAGQSPLGVWAPTTINSIVVVGAAPEAAGGDLARVARRARRRCRAALPGLRRIAHQRLVHRPRNALGARHARRGHSAPARRGRWELEARFDRLGARGGP